ncbi:DUF6349 family protein [Pseudonocardia sp. ICBG1034]|uniref:DUF6349 family protein n=1 Tax=Pseudonocardia sp. ICBG1034 TaxID=2844381 RepID=UPI001CCB0826|nr:DUF6349 family protein [Pseudonocardia sp. ICBG1034]
MADWLGTVEELPGDRSVWPCQRCDAAPGDECSTSGGFFHHGRGFAGGTTHLAEPTETCRPTAQCGPGPAWRAACLCCDHRGDVVDSESLAVELAHDHSFPGWRLLPTVSRKPNLGGGGTSKAAKGALAKWLTIVNSMYPDGWLERGGPVLTHRPGYLAGTRHVPAAVPGGGYDICVSVDDAALVLGALQGLHLRDFLPGCDQQAAKKLLEVRPGSWGQAGAKGLHRGDRAMLPWDRYFELIERGCSHGRRERYEQAHAAWQAAPTDKPVEVRNDLIRTTRGHR